MAIWQVHPLHGHDFSKGKAMPVWAMDLSSVGCVHAVRMNGRDVYYTAKEWAGFVHDSKTCIKCATDRLVATLVEGAMYSTTRGKLVRLVHAGGQCAFDWIEPKQNDRVRIPVKTFCDTFTIVK